ncbi:MAG: hypothetical protein HY525_20425 [Betaproteobacteria bacterium]|nr:hypothetical protein [Betaproteobacteria bacterium]
MIHVKRVSLIRAIVYWLKFVEPDRHQRVMTTDRPIQEAGQPQQPQPSVGRDNDLIAMQLRDAADLVRAQGANPFRAGA